MSNDKGASRIKYLLLIVSAIALATCAACCFFKEQPTPPPPPPEIREANRDAGKEILESLANGALLYSVQHGGNGKKGFPTNVRDISENLPPVIQQATYGYASSPVHIDGYLGRMSPESTSDNFVFEAYPANGFKGDILVISIDMKVMTSEEYANKKKENITTALPTPPKLPTPQKGSKSSAPKTTTSPSAKTRYNQARNTILAKGTEIKNYINNKINPPPPPPPPIQDANPATAKELLRSLYTAAKYYSVQHGGNGEKNFPTRVLEICNAIPDAVKKAIVFKREEEEKAQAIDGYILIMYPSKSIEPSDNFCFMAYPAKNFRGASFEIDKSGNIREIK